MRHGLVTLAALLVLAAGVRADTVKPALLQKPTLSKTHIAFVYAGDLWLVGRDGGEAKRLTSGMGLEFDPIFSPDGKQIAFTGEYDGNLDVFVMPATGGEPKRLTYHPGVDVAVGWTPDGKSILLRSTRNVSSARFGKLFTLRADGKELPVELPLPMGEQGAFSPDGKQIAYVPYWNRRFVPNNYIAWKRYRGGLASPIWIADLADSQVEKLPRTDSNDFCPMWLDGKVWFLSDRNGGVALFSYDPATKQVKQALENNGYDLISAAAGPDGIVYEQFGSLHVFDPKTGHERPVMVQLTGDFPAARPHYKKVAKQLRNPALSPTGARVAFEARGEVLTVPAQKGDIRTLTGTADTVERDPAWSPDGQTLAYFSDEGGEYLLHLKNAKGMEPARKLALGEAPNFYFNPAWSPDGKKISYSDNRQQLWFIDVASGKSTKVDSHTYFTGGGFDLDWSPDSRWIAYSKVLPNRLGAIFLYDTQANKRHQVTDGMSDAGNVVFDKDGKHLYFTASTDVGPTTNGIDMSGMNRPVTSSIYLVVLSKDTPSPLAPESDEEKGKPAEPAGKKPDSDKDKEKAEKKDTITKIDVDGLDQRVLALPLAARNYVGLGAGKAGTLLIFERPLLPVPPPPGQPPGPMGDVSVSKFEFKTRKPDKVIDNISAFDISANGEKVLYRQRDGWFVTALATPLKPGDGALKLEDMEVYVDPRAEWRQMYREVWRIQRDFLYDPNYHGYDIAAAEKRYAPFLDSVAHRADLNYLFNEMLGQMVLGHTYIGGGDLPEVTRVRGGLLGADYAIENGRYRIAKVYNGENWNPQLRAPLTQPGVNVKEGDYLLAVNGKDLRSTDNIYRAFEATAGKGVALKIGPNPDGTNARDVTVVPVDSEMGLRSLAWVENNRRKVDQMTDGKVAYVYLPDTGVGGFTNFNRYFFAQVDKDAAIIDERFNGGGKAADYIIEALRRPLLNYWTARTGKVYTTPGGAIFGPKVMLINEFAGSGGDAMPWYFRKAGVGPLIGKRTWGGLVGISGYPPLLDGGMVTAPSFAFFTPEGTWDVENRGVSPDIEVDYDPYLVRQGRDPQLEKAVEVVLEKLKKNPPPRPKKPPYPNYHKKTGNVTESGGRK